MHYNDTPTFVTLKPSDTLALRQVVGFTRMKSRDRSSPKAHLFFSCLLEGEGGGLISIWFLCNSFQNEVFIEISFHSRNMHNKFLNIRKLETAHFLDIICSFEHRGKFYKSKQTRVSLILLGHHKLFVCFPTDIIVQHS